MSIARAGTSVLHQTILLSLLLELGCYLIGQPPAQIIRVLSSFDAAHHTNRHKTSSKEDEVLYLLTKE
jgi:hypothetical protein